MRSDERNRQGRLFAEQRREDAVKRELRILVSGPAEECEDIIGYVYERLDWYTRKYDKVILVDDVIPGCEYSYSPENWSSFPLAARWAMQKGRLSTLEKYHAVFRNKKHKERALDMQIREQLRNVDKVFVFRDFEDERTERIVHLAKAYRVPIKEIRV